MPRIQRAIRFAPSGGALSGLRPIELLGDAEIDPRSNDFFRAVIAERKRLTDSDLPERQRRRLSGFLKVLATSCYGIYLLRVDAIAQRV